ncbi:NADAR family protein [Streptomyces sp. NRRL WC-3742]|uniref:NADAR family protein n=1 Tax=Streptomyces sp. NRRL WC-3742 TaxID=1463934 RepID=UPI00099C95BF|nr:NADAR family protein [Streptomyces sp. NRRL WC-3742]
MSTMGPRQTPATLADVRTRADLAALMATGVQPKWVMFWGHTERKGGGTRQACLSQWWPQPFTVDGVTYASAEHWMMAGKARMFDDHATAARILDARTPAEAKKLGRLVKDFDDETWVANRFELVVEGNIAKFQQDENLLSYLLSTNTRVLVEASPLDQIWGIGLAADDIRAQQPDEWRGLNLLGFALMEARARLAQ